MREKIKLMSNANSNINSALKKKSLSRPGFGGVFSSAALHSPAFKRNVFFVFIFIVLLTGGASRPDVVSLLALRPMAFLFLGYACLVISREEMQAIRGPFALMVCFAAIMALQLIPLPPAIWSSLPQRDAIYAVSQDLNLENLWRPISLVPSRTLNSLLSLSVPTAAMMLFAILDERDQRRVPIVVIAMGIASMIFGLLQVAGPSDGPLYTYEITNNGVLVGFFANRNHHAAFLACLIPLAVSVLFAKLSKRQSGKSQQNFLYIAMTVAMIVFVLPYILVTGSRAGVLLAITGLVMAASLWALWLAGEKRRADQPNSRTANKAVKRSDLLRRLSIVPIVSAVILLGVAAAVYLDRDFALNRYQQLSDVEELRGQTLPVLAEIAKTHFAFGSGFGSFEALYKMWEPDNLLRVNYLNQAHNDAMQLVIEGGIPALAIFAGLLWILSQRVATLVRTSRENGRLPFVSIAWFFVILMICAASLPDYPLRTPIMMVVFTLAICSFVMPGHLGKPTQIRPDL